MTPDLRGSGPTRYWALENLVGTILAHSLLVLLIVMLPEGGGRAAVGVLYLVAAPALSVYLPLRGKDILSAVIVAAATAVVVNAVVAELMIATGTWSITGGVVAIAVISVMVAVVGYVSAAVRPRPSPIGSAHPDATGGP
jgi:hypothetical protein